ncbi:MAG: adenylate/guanylate cyclase domain-containing protein [Burkholderiales bacterium]
MDMGHLNDFPDSGAKPAEADGGGSILLVDDTPANARLISDVLGFHGYSTHVAASGESALRLLAREAIDLVVLDVVMPGIDGFETCRLIRADPQYAMLPIVMATSLDSKTDRVRGLEVGADDFLSKPINHQELIVRVRSLIRIKRLYDRVTSQRTELAVLAQSLERRVAEEVEKSERLSGLKRFFSPQLVDLIVAGGADNPLASHRREITVVFLDLRGFTAFADTGEPEVVMQALSEFHHAMGQLVMQHQGTLERFTGDGMMVFFNDPVPVAEPTKRAAQMAIEMCEQAAELRRRWAKRGFDLGLGIGVAHGFATVGAIGFDHRIDYAAIGPVTNLAARLCAHAQAGEILVSQRAFGAIENWYSAESLGEIAMRGFSKPVATVRLLGIKR